MAARNYVAVSASWGPNTHGETSVSLRDNAERGRRKLAQVGLADAWEVVVADDNHIQLDYDTPRMPRAFYSGLMLLRQRLGLHERPAYTVTRSRSGNVHVHIPLADPMPLVERIAWQAVLGSDQLREGISLINVHRGADNPVLLFERKG